MKVRAFLIADAVSSGEEGKLFIHGGGITRITGSFPLTQPALSILVRLEREDEELGTDHQLVVRMINPAGAQVVELDTNYRIPGSANEQYPMTVDFVGGFTGLEFEEPGLYHFVAVIDGTEVDRLPLALDPPEDQDSWKSQRRTTGG